ncbi:NUDIX hydrolase [Candidatus Entotheonella palauensis]|uniref:NUDIX hydrolase n=1 Tax=Candidatus Entotheonella gemina TaxID=1429439 RepID=W4MDU9_9BACT|nr:NUDIX domain-containing protein [Candidatus Entotheonella palauensis]ETX07787.1 MAG: NUDIX hydrolase [Candidatus Entotheonella gemina]
MNHQNDLYDYPRPAVAVDCVVFGVELDERELKVLLIQRDNPPFQGQWALPGGYVRLDESLDDAARRELAEETNLTDIYLEQLYTFGAVDRDPRGRIITVAYYALVKLGDYLPQGYTDARDAAWFSVDEAIRLAFDHDCILAVARERLRNKVGYEPIGFELLPPKFTLTELQNVYETILERALDKRNFRKKILSFNILDALDEIQKDVMHRAARLYRFNSEKYETQKQNGMNFQL